MIGVTSATLVLWILLGCGLWAVALVGLMLFFRWVARRRQERSLAMVGQDVQSEVTNEDLNPSSESVQYSDASHAIYGVNFSRIGIVDPDLVHDLSDLVPNDPSVGKIDIQFSPRPMFSATDGILTVTVEFSNYLMQDHQVLEEVPKREALTEEVQRFFAAIRETVTA